MNNDIKEILEDIREHSDSKYINPLELIDTECKLLLDYITNLQEENEELKMTNLALADDITKNKIIKQEVLTECCGIPIGEIPMLKIQNDEYKQKINKAIEYNEKVSKENWYGGYEKEIATKNINLLQGKSDE